MIWVVFLIQKLLLLLHSIIQCFFRVFHTTLVSLLLLSGKWQFTSICLFLVLGLKNCLCVICFFFSFYHSVAFISIILRFSLPYRENVCEIKTCNDNGHFHEFSLVCGLSICAECEFNSFSFHLSHSLSSIYETNSYKNSDRDYSCCCCWFAIAKKSKQIETIT